MNSIEDQYKDINSCIFQVCSELSSSTRRARTENHELVL